MLRSESRAPAPREPIPGASFHSLCGQLAEAAITLKCVRRCHVYSIQILDVTRTHEHAWTVSYDGKVTRSLPELSSVREGAVSSLGRFSLWRIDLRFCGIRTWDGIVVKF